MAGRARLQFSMCPRWLEYSKLPQVLGPTGWAVFRALVVMDHQTLRLKERRHGRGGSIFAVPQADLIAVTGLSDREVRRQVARLAGSKLLSYHRAGTGRHKGGGGQWGRFSINTKTLVILYRYVGPRLRRLHGGTQDLTLAHIPEGGIQIYGLEDVGAVKRSFPDLSAAETAKDIGTEPPELDVRKVAEICGI